MYVYYYAHIKIYIVICKYISVHVTAVCVHVQTCIYVCVCVYACACAACMSAL